jgi:hypothetical protein
MGALLPLIHGIYWQILRGEQWGNRPMSTVGLVALSTFVLLVCCLVTWILTAIKLHVIIDAEGVHYRFFPHEPRWQAIRREEIIDFKVEKKNILNRSVHHRKWFSTKSMNVNGSDQLLLFLINGKKLKLGSNNPEGLKWAMRRLIPRNEII